MSEVYLCEYCSVNIRPKEEDYVVVEKERENRPGKYAHPDCHRSFRLKEELERLEED